MTKKIAITLFLALLGGSSYSQKMNVAKLDSLFQILETKDKFMGSIAVSQNGTLLYSKSIGMDDTESNKKSGALSKYRVGSISKMFTSALVFKAVEEKKLMLTQTIETFFPTIENASKITIGYLLNHRSGIQNFTSNPEYLNYNTQPKSEKEMVAIITKGKSIFEPNSKADYSNSNYVLLSYILEKTYKKPFKTILNDKIIKPLGLKNTYVGGKINILNNETNSYSFSEKWIKEPETDMSIPMGAGAIVSNPQDLAVFIEKLFANAIITENSLKQMTKLQDNYGMGIFQYPFYEKKSFGHTGGIDEFRSTLSYFPDDKLAVALTSNGRTYENNDIMIAALSAYYNKPFTVPTFKTIILKTEDLDPYLGEYSDAGFPMKITITKENTTLFAQATGQAAFPLEATEKDNFEFKMAGIKLEFKPVERQMILKQSGGKFTLTKK
ncbi:CubicO group peptidase, beta-lactamase class C family [Flavobacterium fryxellicola]|uniref:Peptidase n=1 Tax=Flavobacterium fryxellicola TaxID=249352 RepID=A0A167UZH2_9FLAO|nr:serine hydrolase domain-containing protein [Flavobacterium fryxellicola]OAB25945.1 peptidase [Flavobacterium fryxellicola]SHN69008.1 CubicO group peptidase, beta-lactamase class C family [Flavobacterium fryxellicola]